MSFAKARARALFAPFVPICNPRSSAWRPSFASEITPYKLSHVVDETLAYVYEELLFHAGRGSWPLGWPPKQRNGVENSYAISLNMMVGVLPYTLGQNRWYVPAISPSTSPGVLVARTRSGLLSL